jgi:hypothetical protein
MPSCNTGRNIQKYKGAAASTLQDVTDNGNTTTGDIITTSGFFIGDGSKLSGIVGVSTAFTLQETSDRGNTTSNTIQFTNPITSLTTSGNVIVTGNVTAYSFYGSGSGLTTLNASNISSGTLSNDRLDTKTGTGNIVMSVSPTLSGTITGGTFSGTHIGTGSGLTTLNASNISSGTLSISRGGTNRTSYGTGDILYASSSSVLSNLAPSTTGYFLRTNGTGFAPTWENVADIGSATPANLYTDDYITGGPWSGLTDANIRVLGNVSNLSNQLVARDNKGDIFVSNVNAIRIYGDGTSLIGVALNTDLVSNVIRIGNLESNLAANVIRIGNLESNLAANVIRIGNLESNLAANVIRIGNLESNLTANSTRITNLQNSTIISNSSGITNAFETGDLIYASGQNTLSNLSIGSTNEVLTVSGGIPTWAAPSGGGGGGYWTQSSGTNIYYNSGNVGIGTTTPAYTLDVDGDIRTTSENGFRGNGRYITSINITSERNQTIINFGQQSSLVQSVNGDPL